jgi:hypothetical protein
METSAYRLLLTEIYEKNTREITSPQEKLCQSFEDLQKFLSSQDPAELPVALQLAITASTSFHFTDAYCENTDFEEYGGWTSFYVQSQVMKLYTFHNCQTCRTGSLRGCIICLAWISFSGYDLIVDDRNVEMGSSRFNGYSDAVEGTASLECVKLNFKSPNPEPKGCSILT